MRVHLSSLLAVALLTAWLAEAGRASAAEECTGARVDWRFRASSPISPPIAADAEGRVFFATHEGYVDGLGADGRFLWGYPVSGGLLFGVSLDEAGRLYTASTDGKVWALAPDGAARWVFQAPVRPESPLVVGPKHAATFVTGASMHAVSSRAGLLWGVPLGGATTGVPLRGPLGETWVSTENGWLHAVQTPFRRERWRVAQGPIELFAVSSRVALVAVDGKILAVDRDGKTAWSLDGVQAAAVDSRGAEQGILVRSASLDFVELESGQSRGTVPYAERVSASPLLVGHRAYVPREDGWLDIVEPGGVRGSCRVGSASLYQPIVAGSRIVVADGSGGVTSLVVEELR